MGSLTVFLRTATVLFLAALALTIVVQLVRGRISLRGLLSTSKAHAAHVPSGVRSLSPNRIQLLMITVAVGGYVLVEALRHPGTVPSLPLALPLLFAASHAVYLAGKLNRQILSRSR